MILKARTTGYAQHEEASGAAELRVLFDEEDARAVLLVRAVEEADPRGRFLPHAERERASADARQELGDDAPLDGFLASRARRLVPRIEEAGGPGRLLLDASALGASAWRIVLVALAFGLATNLLGPERGINVLANPITALLAWNVLVYAVFAGGALRRAAAPDSDGPLPALVPALASWRLRRCVPKVGEEAQAREAVIAAASSRYLAGWRRAGRRLLAARVRRTLHLGAAVVALAALGGTYARGLLFEYQVVWESTFLDAGTVDGILRTLLGPASVLSGIDVPSATTFGLERPGPAATWIHLFAVTAGIVIVAPRGVLAARQALCAWRLARAVALDLDEPYFRRLSSALRGRGVEAEVLPYSYRLEPRRGEALKRVLHDVLGARAHVVVRDALPYGEGPPPPEHGESVRVLLFNLAQTPESEVHARLAADVAASARDGARALALVDASAWRERTAGSPAVEERVGEHRRTWNRMLREARIPVVHLDLDRAGEEGLVERIEEALAGRSAEEVRA